MIRAEFGEENFSHISAINIVSSHNYTCHVSWRKWMTIIEKHCRFGFFSLTSIVPKNTCNCTSHLQLYIFNNRKKYIYFYCSSTEMEVSWWYCWVTVISLVTNFHGCLGWPTLQPPLRPVTSKHELDSDESRKVLGSR